MQQAHGAPQPACRTLVNGEPEGAISPADRGLTYGDGVFRTLAVRDRRPRWWPAHLGRLAADAARLAIAAPPESVWLDDLARLQLPEHGVLRLTLTRGAGPRGYRPPRHAAGTRIVSVWATAPTGHGPEAIGARLCSLRLGHQPALAGVKHLNRLEQVLARAEWSEEAVREGILLDQDGRVISGVMSNLFVLREGVLHTPALDRCGVAGVARDRLMAVAQGLGLEVRVGEVSQDMLWQADEIVFTNSLILLWRVARLGERTWPAAGVSRDLWAGLYAS